MKKLYFLVIVLLGIFIAQPRANAQEGYAFQESDLIINAGIGLGSTFAFTGSYIPFGASVEYGITDAIGVGGLIGYGSGSGLSVFHIGAKGSYHFNELLNLETDLLDLYAGLSLYYRNFSVSGINFNIGSGVLVGFHIGGRYYFSESFGVFAELGNGIGWLTAGVAFKL